MAPPSPGEGREWRRNRAGILPSACPCSAVGMQWFCFRAKIAGIIISLFVHSREGGGGGEGGGQAWLQMTSALLPLT